MQLNCVHTHAVSPMFIKFECFVGLPYVCVGALLKAPYVPHAFCSQGLPVITQCMLIYCQISFLPTGLPNRGANRENDLIGQCLNCVCMHIPFPIKVAHHFHILKHQWLDLVC